jgi:hypothetical protein
LPIEVTLAGTIKAVNAEAAKALVPIVLSLLPVSTDTVVSEDNDAKAVLPIEVTLAGTVKEVNAVLAKASSPIVWSALPVSTDAVARERQY